MRLAILLVALFAWTSPARAADLVIRDVTVIDAVSNTQRPHLDVEINGGRIVAVRRHSRFRRGRVQTINGRGRFLIPGLWDAHVHLFNLSEPALPLLIAQGITSVRDMGGDAAELAQWRARIERGELIGPRIKYCGPMLEGAGEVSLNHEQVLDPSAARAIVTRLAAAGVDCIKMRGFADEATYRALAEAARTHGLPLFGHAPFGLDPVAVAPLGQRTLEHAFYPYPFHSLPDERRAAIIAAFRDAGLWIAPTMVAWEPSRRDPEALAAELASLTPEVAATRFVSTSMHANWAEGVAYSREERRGSPGWVRAINQAAADAGEMHRGGVPVLAGTDLGAPFVQPDTALHDELVRLVNEVGLTPAEALAAATWEPARLFGLTGELGTVEAGKLADLVLLEADPLADIAAVRRVETVIYRGVVYDRAAREALRQRVREGLRAAWRDNPPPAPTVAP